MTKRRSVRFGILLTTIVTATVALATYICLTRVDGRTASASNDASNRLPASTDLPSAQQLSNMFGESARKVLPSVVQIKADVQYDHRPDTLEWSDRLGELPFGGFVEEEAFGANSSSRQNTLGCGVIIDPAGLVLTNNHIVEGAAEMLVELADGQQFRVKNVKTDPQTDLALLTLDGTQRIPAAQLGESNGLRVGDWVLTIGSPLGLEQTVSAGIISAKGRSVDGAGTARLLQTDAAINPGSSGGALVNLQGELVGITTAIASRDGGYQGVGFAIPVDLAKWVTTQLREHGQVRRGFLGATFAARPVGSEAGGFAEVRVARVIANSPANRAGMLVGDTLISVDGQPVGGVVQLNEYVERAGIGSSHRFEVSRDHNRKVLELVIEETPDSRTTRSPISPNGDARTELVYSRDLGIVVSDVSGRIAEQLGLETAEGVLVVRSDRGGAGLRAGIRKGMVIMRISNQQIGNASEFAEIMEGESLEAGIRIHVHGRGGLEVINVGGAD